MLFDAHHHAFVAWGGIPRRGIYDNMKTAVDRVGRGKSREVNARFSSIVSHYLFDAQFCNPASGWEKGQIEKSVQDSRRRIWQQCDYIFRGFSHIAATRMVLAGAQVAEVLHPRETSGLPELVSLMAPPRCRKAQTITFVAASRHPFFDIFVIAASSTGLLFLHP